MLPEKIIWTEGMLLRPQHFQQQDRYIDTQLRKRGKDLFHYGWGFTDFKIDEQYLSLGKIVLSEAAGFFPDGTLFVAGRGQDPISLEIPVGFTNKSVVLALPMTPEGASEARGEHESGLSTRYIAHPVEVHDNNAGQEQSVSVQCGRPALELMFADDVKTAAAVTMPVAQIIECKPDKSIILDNDFAPTFMHLAAAPLLSGYLREVIGLLSHRGDQLALRVSNAGQTGTAEIADFLLLQSINRMEPIFRHQDKTANLHPEEFYIKLLALVGELSSFTESGKRPHDIADYDHVNQQACIAQLMEQTRYALSMVLEQHAVELPMQKRQYGIIVSPIHDRNLLAGASFILAVGADMESDVLRGSLPKQLKISSVERIRELVNLHLPGIKIRALPVAPRQIPFHAGKTYFKLDFSSDELAQLELSGGFAFYISGTFPGLQMQFWAIKE